MHFMNYRRLGSIACGVAIAALAVPCEAHFLWVKTVTVEGQPQALLLFGESPADEAYHFPEKLAKTKVVEPRGRRQANRNRDQGSRYRRPRGLDRAAW